MAAFDPFISQQDLSDRIGRDVSTYNGALAAVDAACDICRAVADQDFNFSTDTIRLDGSGSDVLVLPQWPVSGAGTVLVNGVAEDAFEFTETGLLFRGSAGNGFNGSGLGSGAWGGYAALGQWRPIWPSGRQNVQVTYDHGYGTADFPTSLRMVALSIAARIVVQGEAMSETVGADSVRYAVSAGDLDKNELRILQRYRHPRS